MAPLHNQLMVNGKTYSPFRNEDGIKNWLTELVEAIGMKIVMGPHAFYVSKEGNQGLTAFVGIETSHIAIHIWDEPNPALIQFDLYTCSTLPVDLVLENLEERLGLIDYKYVVLEREHDFNLLAHNEVIHTLKGDVHENK